MPALAAAYIFSFKPDLKSTWPNFHIPYFIKSSEDSSANHSCSNSLIRELIDEYPDDVMAVAADFDRVFSWKSTPVAVQITGHFISPFQFALAVLQVGGTQGWFEQPDTNDEATMDLLVKRINTAFEHTGLSIRDFA